MRVEKRLRRRDRGSTRSHNVVRSASACLLIACRSFSSTEKVIWSGSTSRWPSSLPVILESLLNSSRWKRPVREVPPCWRRAYRCGHDGISSDARRASQMLHSEPYLEETLAFVVKDQLREEFSSWANIRELGSFSVLIPALPYFIDVIRTRAPLLKLTVAASMMQIEQAIRNGTSDAVVLPAERGSVLSLALSKVHRGCAGTGNCQNTTRLSGGPPRSRVGNVSKYLDRAETARRHHRGSLRAIGSGKAGNQKSGPLVGHSQRARLGRLIPSGTVNTKFPAPLDQGPISATDAFRYLTLKSGGGLYSNRGRSRIGMVRVP